MSCQWKKVIVSFLVVAMIAVFCVGCGGDEEGKVVLTIGEVSDFTGPASPAANITHKATVDAVRYFNEKGLIPGVRIKLVSWDTQWNPARNLPGYEWVRGRGADMIYTLIPGFAETMKAFAARDKIPILVSGTTIPMVEPPGWVFCFTPTYAQDTKTVLKWLSDEHWDYSQGIPKIGMAAWQEPTALDMKKALSEYCQDHPEQFDYVGTFLAPMGVMTWSAQVEKLKGCDYVFGPWGAEFHFMQQFHERGYTATFVGPNMPAAFQRLLVDCFGWEPPLDGMISTAVHPWWGEAYTMIELAEETLHEYRSGEVEDVIDAGCNYIGTFQTWYAILEILKAAVEEVGAENFDGQAYYNAAVKYRSSGPIWEGYPPDWGFSETRRCWQNHQMIYEWSAEAKDLVRVSDWLPLVVE